MINNYRILSTELELQTDEVGLNNSDAGVGIGHHTMCEELVQCYGETWLLPSKGGVGSGQ